jgi:hypothetical protein
MVDVAAGAGSEHSVMPAASGDVVQASGSTAMGTTAAAGAMLAVCTSTAAACGVNVAGGIMRVGSCGCLGTAGAELAACLPRFRLATTAC